MAKEGDTLSHRASKLLSSISSNKNIKQTLAIAKKGHACFFKILGQCSYLYNYTLLQYIIFKQLIYEKLVY